MDADFERPVTFTIRKQTRFLAFLFTLVLVPVTMRVSSAASEEGAAAYFTDTYQEARLKFIAAAAAAGGSLERYRNPHQGAEGEALYSDVATFNLSGAKTILVIGSGTHGVEGFAGSAIQVGLLREGITEELPDDVGMLFYHALNPYGYSHIRRFNEKNVDVNRNFHNHAQPHPSNEDYNKVRWIAEPESLSAWENFKARVGLAWYRIIKGARWLQSAISRGQYDHPHGLFFGGITPSWSNHTLHEIVKRHVATAARVVLIDVHTGLGEYGAAIVFTEEFPGTPGHEWMVQCWDIPISHRSIGDVVSSLPIDGSLKGGFTRMLPNAEVIGGSLEFGTYPPLEVFWALRAENYIHHHGGWTHPDALRVKEELKRVFYPKQNDWKHSVWRQGSRLVKNTIKCLR